MTSTQINTNILLPAALPRWTPPTPAAPSSPAARPLITQNANTTLRLPEQLTLGTAVKVTAAFTALFDAP